jgi:branched-chain amino acid transport system permease protein
MTALPIATARTRSSPRRWARRAPWAAGLLLALFWPDLAGTNYLVSVGTLALTFLMVGQSLNLVYGYAGYLCMSVTVFWGTGGFVAAHFNTVDGMNPLTAIALGGAIAGALAFAFGLLTMQRGRQAFAIVSLVFLVFAGILANSWTGLTGGAQGIAGLPVVTVGPASWHLTLDTERHFYYGTLALAILVMGVLTLLLSSRWGRTLRATNLDEPLAASFGIRLGRERLRAITIAGVASGLAGGLHVFSTTVADPSLVSIAYLAPLFAIVFLGGPGNFGGVTVAAIVVTFLPELTRDFESSNNLVYGLLLVALCVLFPEGLPATTRRLWHARVRG